MTIFSIIAAILHLGNLEIRVERDGDACSILVGHRQEWGTWGALHAHKSGHIECVQLHSSIFC